MTLFGLIGGKQRERQAGNGPARAPAQAAPGTAISYDAGLVPRLTQEHRKLLGIYQQLQLAVTKTDVAAIQQRLREFRGMLQEHLLQENVKLYVYLARHLAGDQASSELVSDMRREMMGIGRVVMDFLRKYTDSPMSPGQVLEFKKELDAIGAALVQRIEREESALYSLYLESY